MPAIVLAHGLGAIKELGLDRYAERFSAAGFLCIVFDYRCFGSSTGTPRGLININMQLADWEAAIQYAAGLPEVDPQRVVLFGSSFSGGHVIRLAAMPKHASTVCAVISQCPFTDGIASCMQLDYSLLPWVLGRALKDAVFGTARIPIVAKPGELALMNTPDAYPGYRSLLPPGVTSLESEEVPARIALAIPFYRPGTYAAQVKAPIFFGVCGTDSVAPPNQTLAFARQAPKGTVRLYEEMGHFDIYSGERFEKAVADYLGFLKQHVPSSS